MIELVASRQPDQVGDGLGDEGRGLVRPAIPGRLIGSRARDPFPEDARFRRRPVLVKNYIQYPCIVKKYPLLRVQL